MVRILEQGKNRATPDEAASFVDQFEDFEEKIASERGSFMARCKAIREKQKELLDDAKSQGVAKGLVKAAAKARELEAKIKALTADLEPDDKSYFVDIRKALGDDFSTLPLGVAAVDAEDTKPKGRGKKKPDTAGVVDAATKAWAEADAAREAVGH